MIIKISDLFEISIDELLKADEELTKKVIKESKQLAHLKLKFLFDVFISVGLVLLVVKLVVLFLNKITALEIALYGGSFLWNFGSLILMVVGGFGSSVLKEKYKQD